MTTAITTVYDALAAFVLETLPAYKKLANPYKHEDNPSVILKKGFGIKIKSGTNSKRFVGQLHSTKRTFTVILTCEMLTTEGNSAQWRAAELGIMEDAQALICAIHTSSTVAEATTNAEWTEDSGIDFVDGDRCRYLTTEIGFAIEYVEAN